jgi:uncharacterized protein
MKTILITGGTGLVGKALTSLLLAKSYNVIILTRKIPNTNSNQKIKYALWDIDKKTIDVAALQQADAIIHLAGAGVMDKSWTPEYKLQIEKSRTESGDLLIKNLTENKHKVKVLVSSSAIGWYGEDKKPSHFFTEDEPADKGFLGETCKRWEASVEPAKTLGIRLVMLRTGIVLSKVGGAYVEFRKTIPFGLASVLGNGNQMVSWIHIDDICNQYLFALENELLEGSYNAVAPLPVNNKTLTTTIAKKLNGKFFITLPVPIFMLKLILGERSIEILKSTTVSAEKIKNAGYKFIFSTIEDAVNDLEH